MADLKICVCLFVSLIARLFACLLVCLLACLFVCMFLVCFACLFVYLGPRNGYSHCAGPKKAGDNANGRYQEFVCVCLFVYFLLFCFLFLCLCLSRFLCFFFIRAMINVKILTKISEIINHLMAWVDKKPKFECVPSNSTSFRVPFLQFILIPNAFTMPNRQIP